MSRLRADITNREAGQALTAYLSSIYGGDGDTASKVMSGILVGMQLGLENPQLATEVLNDTFSEEVVGQAMAKVTGNIRRVANEFLEEFMALPLVDDKPMTATQEGLKILMKETLKNGYGRTDEPYDNDTN